jgi:hypothetical protein
VPCESCKNTRNAALTNYTGAIVSADIPFSG